MSVFALRAFVKMRSAFKDTRVAEVKRIRGKKQPLTAAGLHALRDEYTRATAPARALAAEALTRCRMRDAECGVPYGLIPAEVGLVWQTAPPRMPIPPPATAPQVPVQAVARPHAPGLARGPVALPRLPIPHARDRRH